MLHTMQTHDPATIEQIITKSMGANHDLAVVEAHSRMLYVEFKRPWNARHDATRLPPSIPKAQLWAYDPNGISQIGCIYTAQGFEFDYVGVIIGEDLIHDLDSGKWMGKRENSADPVVKRSKDKFLELTKNTYRVLLSRGLKGCYVHFINKDTERFFKSRMED